MSIISNVIVVWNLSPRIIIIPVGTVDVNIEDLQDTLLDLEASVQGMPFTILRNTSGGESLGAGTTVGWTMELLNAQIAFAANTIIDESGTATSSGTTTLVDIAADFVSNGVNRGASLINYTDGSIATVIEVVDLNTITHQTLVNGVNNDWTIGDVYTITNEIQCNILGGNLVAIDSVGAELDPVFPTVGTQVVRTSSSSATLQELEAIQYSSYQNGVWLDVINGTAGNTYPAGTREQPTNNLDDAKFIALDKGFDVIFVIGNLTVDATADFTNFSFVGQNPDRTTVSIVEAANMYDCEFKDASVTGYLDGGCLIEDCVIYNIYYVRGLIINCMLEGSGQITLAGTDDSHFLDCKSGVVGGQTPTINMGGNGRGLGLRGYSGGIELTNKNGEDDLVSIDLVAGAIILDSTVVSGTIVARGIGNITNNAADEVIIDSSALISQQLITETIWESVHIDTVNGVDSTEFPAGTPGAPCKTLANAEIIAEEQTINTYHLFGEITLSGTYDNYSFVATQPDTGIINLAGQSINDADFKHIKLFGNANGEIHAHDCIINDGVTNLEGTIIDGFVTGEITAKTNLVFRNVAAGGRYGAIIDLDSAPGCVVGAAGLYGTWTLKNTVNGPPPNSAALFFDAGILTLDPSCIGGAITIGGIVTVHDNAGSGCTIDRDSQIEASPGAYREKILVDIDNGVAGTNYPIGTTGYPVNNIEDAKVIAVEKNLHVFHIHGDVTLSGTWTDYIFMSDSYESCKITCSGTNVSRSVFNSVEIVGDVEGELTCNNCNFPSGFTNIYGHVINCALEGAFTLNPLGYFQGSMVTSLNGLSVDLNGTGTLAFDNSSVLLTVTNGTDPSASIGVSGNYAITIDSTCTAGQAIIGGVGVVIDNSNGMTVLDYTLPGSTWNQYLGGHTTAGTYGAELATKSDIAASTSTDVITVTSGTIIYGTEDAGTYTDTYTRDNIYWEIGESAVNGITVELLFNLPSVDHRPGTISVFGRYTGNPPNVHHQELWMWNYEDSSWELINDNFMPGGNTSDSLYTHEYLERHIDRTNNNEVKARIVHHVTTYNATHTLYLDAVSISSIKVVTASSIAEAVWDTLQVNHIDAGTFGAYLDAKVSEAGGGSLTASGIAESVWDSLQANHVDIGSFGYYLDAKVSEAGGGSLTASGIAASVWDEQTSAHTTAGTFGKLLTDMEVSIDSITVKLPTGNIAESGEYTSTLANIESYILRALGLVQENFFLDQNTYSTYQGIKLLTSGRIRTYSDASSVGTGSNVTATYQIASVWNGDELTSYKVTKL